MSLQVISERYINKPQKPPSQPIPPLLPLPTVSLITAITAAVRARLQLDPSFFPSSCDPLSAFFSVVLPAISTHEYVERLVRYTDCSPAAFVLMLVYIDRIIQSGKIQFVPHSMHRILLAALTVAVKNTDDIAASSAHYARVGGVPTVVEMNRLEVLFLSIIEYKCFVSPEQYAAYVSQLKLFVPLTYAVHDSKTPDLLNSFSRICRRDQTQVLSFQSCRMSYNR